MTTSENKVLLVLSMFTLAGISIGMSACSSTSNTHASAGQVSSVEEDGDDEVETVISLDDLPASVRTALASVTSDDKVTQVTRDEENRCTTYDIEYTKDGGQWAAEFSSSGAMLENEADDDGEEDDQ